MRPSSFDSSSSCIYCSYLLPIKVGTKARTPKINNVIKWWVLMPIVSISFRVCPVWIRMKFIGIIPNIEAKRKYKYGIPTMGEAKFTNQFGIKGVNLRNSIYQNMLVRWAETMLLNLLNKVGNFFKTNYLAKVKLIKKHKEAPRQEH